MKIPLAEHFHSIQGEGFWVGTPMHFIRLPGCSVGKPAKDYSNGQNYSMEKGEAPTLPTGRRAWLCHTWNDRSFWCDTDFNKHEEVELEELLAETWEQHICLTGGEPLIHPKVIEAFYAKSEQMLHIETSGTISLKVPSDIWLTCSPKINYLDEMIERADELKLLISRNTPELPELFSRHTMVFVSPINHVSSNTKLDPFHYESQLNLEKCQELLKSHSDWRLSIQLHKLLGVR